MRLSISIMGLVLSVLMSTKVMAQCANLSAFNPVTDIAWSCIFPITIAGVEINSTGQTDTVTQNRDPACVCQGGTLPRIGLKTSFWEPSNLIDTAADPYCMLPIGQQLSTNKKGDLGGSLHTDPSTGGKVFQQLHYYQFPAWRIMNMFMDLPCLTQGDFDIFTMTEVIPTWNNEILASIINPEAVLFANPAAALTCSVDALSALQGLPRDSLFWCMGSWGNAYPLAGSITATDYVEANAGLAARGLYMMGRLADFGKSMLDTTTEDGCAKVPMRIWQKSHFRLQLAKPVTDNSCVPIGREGLVWTANKHTLQQDNFLWVVFKKVNCCVSA